MGTAIRAEISQKNKYWITKHRHYELKHFCLQYPDWKKTHSDLRDTIAPMSISKRVTMRAMYAQNIELIEKTARATDPYLYDYIIKGVTEGRSYTYMRTVLNIPCGKDMYYDRYRKFFWLLSESRK